MSLLETTAISHTRPAEFIPGYRLDQLVGTGGMGEVHRATQLSLGRTVAVKLLNSDLARNESFVARFQKEAAALAALSHPHIVSIVDKGHAQDTYFLVMEYVDGPSLRERMRSPLETPAALRIMLEICRAVDYAHGRGVVHRDLKPENILFDQQAGGIAKVTDFGLASFLDRLGAQEFSLTSTHMAMGTLSYMAPEQRMDAKTADARADIFSLGVILYEMLVGEVPMGTFDPPSRRKPELDPRLDLIVTRCLKPDPEDRYARVSALIADLEPLVPTQYSQPPTPPTRMQRLGLGLKRLARNTLRAVAALVVLAALAVLGVAWLRTGEKPERRSPGTLLSEDLGTVSVQSMKGRLEGNPARSDRRRIVMGEGPDPLSVLVTGRLVTFEDKALSFPPAENPEAVVGRAVVDVASLEGDIAEFTGELRVRRAEPTAWERLRSVLYGPPPDPVAAMMLVGRDYRYVALVSHGDGSPLTLEWALGERRGTMTGAIPSPTQDDETARLEMTVDAEGVLRVFKGTGRDRRQLTEPLHLGPRWQEQFHEPPRPAFGCISGTCSATNFTYVVKRAPPPPPVVEASTEPVRPPSTTQTVPARASNPTPPQQSGGKAPPPKSNRRSK